METHDGFAVEQWKELSRNALEHSAHNRAWLAECRLPAAMRLHQSRLQNRAAKKFSDPERWIWTAKLLEQASDEKVARLTAAAFPNDVRILDLCCGAGADTVALATRGAVTAVDRSEVACALCDANVAMHFAGHAPPATFSPDTAVVAGLRGFEVVCDAVESIEISSQTWLHIDPDRRVHARRTIDAQAFHPRLEFLLKAMQLSAGGSIKLAPATKCDNTRRASAADNCVSMDVDRQRIGRQFIAWGGSVRQQRWWWNIDLYPAGTITASIADGEGRWCHWTVGQAEISACDDWSNLVEDMQIVQGYIGDADGCIRAAGLQGLLAEECNAARIGNQFGYFLRRDLPLSSSPWIDWFEIEATIPFDRKRLRALLRDRDVGILEIKVRNVEVAPETLRNEMKLRGSESATVLITRCGPKTLAILGRRLNPMATARDT